jgi:hypothetical protein
MSDTPGQTEDGPQVELTLYADVTTVQLVHEADLWMVAYTHGGAPGAIDHIDTGTLACEVGSAATDQDVVAYIESRLGVAGYSVTRSETPDSVATWEVTPASGEAASA